jgi:hypothetical protein
MRFGLCFKSHPDRQILCSCHLIKIKVKIKKNVQWDEIYVSSPDMQSFNLTLNQFF